MDPAAHCLKNSRERDFPLVTVAVYCYRPTGQIFSGNRGKAKGHQPTSKLSYLMKTLISTVLFCLSSAIAHAAGIQFLQIPPDANGPALKAIVWTPCAEAALEVPIGPYVLSGRRNCPTVGEKLPLIVISHGHGGSFLGHHDLAETLADAGFIVAAINHPGDTFTDMSQAAADS